MKMKSRFVVIIASLVMLTEGLQRGLLYFPSLITHRNSN